MKKYTKPSMEIVDLRVEDKITAPNVDLYQRGVLNALTSGENVIANAEGDSFTGASF